MKKSLLMIAAIFAALTVNAKVITVDLSKATEMAYTGCSASLLATDGVLTVNYTAGGWEWAGVEVALDNLKVTSIDFEYKGKTADWCSFIVYLRADDGARWYDSEDDFSMSHEDWFAKTGYFPTKLMWDASEYALGDRPFTAIGILANPSVATTGTFSVRNVKLTVADATAIDNTAVEAQTTKVIRDGQLFIIRNGVEYNANGQMTK